jgi:hypothetical protein
MSQGANVLGGKCPGTNVLGATAQGTKANVWGQLREANAMGANVMGQTHKIINLKLKFKIILKIETLKIEHH